MLKFDSTYKITINRKTGVTPLSVMHGQECQFSVELHYAKTHHVVLMKDGFAN